MHYETRFARVTTDTSPAAECVHVSPIFVRCGPRNRGAFAERRLARARRSDARHETRLAPEPVFSGLSYFDRVQGW